MKPEKIYCGIMPQGTTTTFFGDNTDTAVVNHKYLVWANAPIPESKFNLITETIKEMLDNEQ